MKRLITPLLLVILLLAGCTQTADEQQPVTNPSIDTVEDTSAKQETIIERIIPKSASGAIIANHEAAMAFEDIPACWLDKAKEELRIGYQHTSHGSQIPSGLGYLEQELGAPYLIGTGNGELKFYDNVIGNYGSDASDLGYGGWSTATENYLEENQDVNAVMWSWCGQVGGHVDDMGLYLIKPAQDIINEYDVTFIFMTGHLDGTGPDGTVEQANNIIREHVQQVNGVLFDFADIESYDPDGNYYPDESDACNWCTTWCEEHPDDCEDLPGCAHSHGFNCVQKAKAYWWLMARMVGWNGNPNQDCP